MSKKPQKTVSAWLEAVRAFEKRGEFFQAADLAERGLLEHPRNPRLEHRTVLALANAGATVEARRRYDLWRLAALQDDEDIQALDARLLKDQAFAEALLARKAELHLVLPFDEAEFTCTAVSPAGPHWVERYKACRARAASFRLATPDSPPDSPPDKDFLFGYCGRIAMGLAILQAGHLADAAEQVVVWDGQPGATGPAADRALWQATGLKPTDIRLEPRTPADSPPATPSALESRRLRAMLFCDVKGFSQLDDHEIPRFVEHLLGRLATVLSARKAADKEAILAANTWGDGIFLVLRDAAEAAGCALDMQAALEGFDYAGAGLPDHLRLRIGGHFGPVQEVLDPILDHTNFFGVHVTKAARIEPVTPEGCIYVTETFAADLAIGHRRDFACDYVGMTESAKQFGPMRMFLLRRAPRPVSGAPPLAG